MVYEFKKFEGKNIRQEKRLTLTRSNQIGFPTRFYTDNEIKKFKYVVLYWDSKNKAIGIYFTNDEKEENKFSIIHSKEGYGGSVVVRSFLRAYSIDPEIYYGRYEWEKLNLEGIGEIFLFKLRERIKN